MARHKQSKKVRKAHQQTPREIAESVMLLTRQADYWRLRIADHPKQILKLEGFISKARQALADEYAAVADAPTKLAEIEHNRSRLSAENIMIHQKPRVEKLAKHNAKMARERAKLEAELGPEALAQLLADLQSA